jgi:RNA polymerase sigma-70 factor (ECF subfamily)
MDDAHFRDAVESHKDRVFTFAAWFLGSREDASDVTQEAFMRLWNHRHRVEPEAGRAWLLKTARRICIDLTRKRRTTCSPEAIDGFLTAGPSDGAALNAETRRAVATAFAELSERDRTLLHLRDVQGLPHEQIGSILGMAHTAVRVGVHRARARHRALLEKAEVRL